ncbi:inositol polyphosphate multikinase isoform X1 [Schistocerca cancellata]|uniref:inositol polyphosphate multikinase isoform X1 n=2 Tax=Schistocerca cancellata TaxID=274614 RepID=UPI0021195B1E|nr:inositol polyphosphate multikinase isoform X1 [Schistocerca cancellata]
MGCYKMVEDSKMNSVFARRKSSEKFLKRNGFNAKLLGLCDRNKNDLSQDTVPLENQVAGHCASDGKSSLGMLKHKDGYVLKPIEKPVQGEREIKFYEELQEATDPVSTALRSFVPQYLGTTEMKINEKDIKFLILKDVTDGFAEPCVMDVKIGKQTWDPEATEEKIKNEQKKYMECKRDLGFCIPGFQVYKISNGKLMKYGKDYGKRLNKSSVIDAFRIFLNADSGLSRHLVLQFVARLWRILCWCRSQRLYRFYSSSLLLIYDARRLRQTLGTGLARPLSPTLSASCSANGRFNSPPASPLFEAPLTPDRLGQSVFFPDRSTRLSSCSSSASTSASGTPTSSLSRQNSFLSDDSWHPSFEEICRTHSLINNYEKDLQSMKENYTFQLEDLLSAERRGTREPWVKIKMIDFAHAFPGVGSDPDVNYLEGIENLVKVFESLLEEVVC